MLASPDITVLFWCSFALTLTLFAVAAVSGRRGQRRVHLVAAPVAVVSLAGTILLAERLGTARVFPEAEMRIHLFFAKSAALLVLPVIVSGVWLLCRSTGRRLHLSCVALFAVTVVIATATGIWAFSLSTPN